MSEEQNIEQPIDNRPQSTENISEPSTINHQPLTNMEVHKHPHHITHKKKWGEYLLEFLMLFLAVFLGFIAENIREHVVEGKKEKEYILSMVEDLRKDSVYLKLCIDKYIPDHIKFFDSTLLLLKSPDAKSKTREIYQVFLLATTWNYNYVPSQRTLAQLRNNGFYLVRNNHASDVLSELDIDYTVYASKNNFVHDLQNDIDQSAYIFADKNIVSHIRMNQFLDYKYSDKKASYGIIDLSEIPASALINLKNSEPIMQFIQKLEKYNYYLNTALQTEYIRLIKTISTTKTILITEYHLKNE